MDNRDFLGKGLSFPLRLDPRTGHFAMSSHEDNIRESVGIILGTYRGERVMRPDFGANTADYAFAPSDSSLQEGIAYDLQRQLVLQEPRIRDIEVSCEEPSNQSGALVVHVSYTVRSTNNRFNQVYPFYTGAGQQEEDE